MEADDLSSHHSHHLAMSVGHGVGFGMNDPILWIPNPTLHAYMQCLCTSSLFVTPHGPSAIVLVPVQPYSGHSRPVPPAHTHVSVSFT
jgi:hypothetical protein